MRTQMRARQRVIHAQQTAMSADVAHAVKCSIHHVIAHATANLKVGLTGGALDEHSGSLDGKRLQEGDAGQCRPTRHRSTCELEVPRTREDDTATHNVIRNNEMQSTGGGCAEDIGAVRRGQTALHEGVQRLTRFKGLTVVRERRRARVQVQCG